MQPYVIFLCQTLADNRLAASRRVSIIAEELLKTERNTIVVALTMEPGVCRRLSHYIVSKQLVQFVMQDPSKDSTLLSRAMKRLFLSPDPFRPWERHATAIGIREIGLRGNPLFVMASSPPHSIHIAATKIAEFGSCRYFADFRDDWARAHRGGYLTPIHRWIASTWEQRILTAADIVIQAIPLVGREWISRKGGASKVKIITNGYTDSDLACAFTIDECADTSPRLISYFGGGYGRYVEHSLATLASEIRNLGLAGNWRIISGGDFSIPPGFSDVWEHKGLVAPREVREIEARSSIQLSLLPPGDRPPSRTVPAKIFNHLLNPGWIAFIGAPGATTEILADVSRVKTFPADKWREVARWIASVEPGFQWRTQRYNYNPTYNISAQFSRFFSENT